MNTIIRMSGSERAEVFAETAERKNLPEAVIEKDFWVCWMLQQLFSIESFSGRLLFKGGTSLSKVFGAINRFSEDIDLAVDYAALGFTGLRDPRREELSASARVKLLDDMMRRCRNYIATEFLSELHGRCTQLLGRSGAWDLALDERDPNVVRFRYPPSAVQSTTYVPPRVVLELGTHAEFVPRGHFTVRAFVAEAFPELVADSEIGVVALAGKRTFWEKVTILHAECHRAADKSLPPKYSRHYYDVAMLAGGPIRAEALADEELLAQVVRHKKLFYPCGWARYDLARRGTLRVVPREDRIPALKQDYRDMAVMIFQTPPTFESILEALKELEQELNTA